MIASCRKLVDWLRWGSRPMVRWDANQLAAEKARLESLKSGEMGLDDHMGVVDYLVQRYLPADDSRSEADWRRTRARLRSRLASVHHVRGLEISTKLAWQARQQRMKVRQLILKDSYFMDRRDFAAVIVPLLERFGFGDELPVDVLFAATASDYRAAAEARDQLLGRCHPGVWEVGANLRSNYEILRRARNARCDRVSIAVGQRCQCFGFLDNTIASVETLLAAFEGRSGGAPTLPPAEAACTLAESPRVCSALITPIMESELEVSPQFSAWMDRVLGRDKPAIPSDWRARLSKRRRAMQKCRPAGPQLQGRAHIKTGDRLLE